MRVISPGISSSYLATSYQDDEDLGEGPDDLDDLEDLDEDDDLEDDDEDLDDPDEFDDDEVLWA